MGIKCIQPGCPHDYECCCYECEEAKNCESHCNLKPETCENSEIEKGTSLEVFKNANIDVINTISQITIAKKKIDVEKYIDQKIPLEKVQDAFVDLTSGTTDNIKIVVKP